MRQRDVRKRKEEGASRRLRSAHTPRCPALALVLPCARAGSLSCYSLQCLGRNVGRAGGLLPQRTAAGVGWPRWLTVLTGSALGLGRGDVRGLRRTAVHPRMAGGQRFSTSPQRQDVTDAGSTSQAVSGPPLSFGSLRRRGASTQPVAGGRKGRCSWLRSGPAG